MKVKNFIKRPGWGTWCIALLVSCGTLVGNPEEEDSTGQVNYRSETHDRSGVTTNAGDNIDVPDSGLSLLLTDAPVDDAKGVYVTMKGISVNPSDGSWIEVPLKEEKEINLLDLQGGDAVLLGALESLPAGKYSEVRIELSDSVPSRLVLNDDSEHSLTVPSGSESGLKVRYDFEIKEKEATVLVLDFDLRKSIVKIGGKGDEESKGDSADAGIDDKSASKSETGAALAGDEAEGKDSASDEQSKSTDAGSESSETASSSKGSKGSSTSEYLLKPVLRVVDLNKSGTISGKADDGEIACVFKSGSKPDATSECENAESSSKARDGKFKLPYLPEGEYSVRVYGKDGRMKDYRNTNSQEGKEVEIIEE
jgi:hypothetical protein